MAEIVSLNLGKPRQICLEATPRFRSSMVRIPVSGKVFLDFLGFEGYQVADPRVHGGPDKAVCFYSMDHYPFWEQELGCSLQPGAFGENLSVRNLDETQVAIGDIYRIGQAEVQCSQPRQPCHKLNKVFRLQEMACRVQTTGYTGFYLRVIKQGWVAAGDSMTLVHRGDASFTVDTMNRFLRRERGTPEELLRALELPALSNAWKKDLKKRLDRKTASPPTSG